MRRLYFLLPLLVVFGLNIQAQISFDFSTSTPNPSPGDIVDIDVSVSDFDDIVSFQVFVMWDSTVISFNSIDNVTSVLPEFSAGSVGTPVTSQQFGDGTMSISWNQSSTLPASVADGTTLFTMQANVVGNPCDSTDLILGNIPPFQFIEVIDADFNEIGAVFNPFGVKIPGPDCQDGGGEPDGVGLIFSNADLPLGDTVCYPVTVQNFTDVQGLQGSMMWDPTVMTYTGVQGFGLPNLSSGGFNATNIDQGMINFVWIDNTGENPATLADGSTIFEICFTSAGNVGEVSNVKFTNDPTPIEISDSDSQVLPFFTDDGNVTITEGDGPPPTPTDPVGLGLIAVDTCGTAGDRVCMSVAVDSFVNVSSLQGGIMWDPNVLEFDAPENFGLPGLSAALFNFANADQGTLSFLWFDNSGQNPQTLDDGEVIFDLCFNLIGSIGDSSTVNFIDSPPLEIANDLGQVIEPFYTQQGVLNILSTEDCEGEIVMPPATFILSTSSPTGDMGDVVCVDITAQNFNDISAIQLTMGWDATVATYSNVTNINSTLNFAQGSFNLVNSGELGLSWNSPTGEGISVLDGTQLFSVCFELTGACESSTSFDFISGSQVPIEIGNGSGQVVPFEGNSATITIDECPISNPPVIMIGTITGTSCFGDSDGSVSALVEGGDGLVTCVWYSGAGTNGAVVSTDCNLSGQSSGVYTLVATDSQGSSDLEQVTITQPNSIDPRELVFSASCTDAGRITTDPIGGTPPYTYLWSNGATTQNLESVIAGTYSVTVTDSNDCTGFVEVEVIVSGSLGVTGTVTDITCDGPGSIALEVNGGSGQFEYNWSPDLGNVANPSIDVAAVYAVTVTDVQQQSCQFTGSFLVNNAIPTLGISNVFITNTSCSDVEDGAIEFLISGGCPDYTCSVVAPDGSLLDCDDLSGLSQGAYNIQVVDSQNTLVGLEVSIGGPSPLVGNTFTTNVSGMIPGAIDLEVSGGTAPYIFVWTNEMGTIVSTNEDIDNLEVGEYSVLITDSNDCTLSVDGIPIIDSDPSLPPSLDNIVVGSDFNGFGVSCLNNCDGEINGSIINGTAPFIITVTDANGDQFNYANFPLTGLCASTYSVQVVDDNDQFSTIVNNITISEPSDISIVIDDVQCVDSNGSNGSISVTVGGGALVGYSFEWNPTGGTNAIAEGLTVGTYQLVVTDGNGCTADILQELTSCDTMIVDPTSSCFESNTFLTPNDDGINDVLSINLDCVSTFNNHIEVFDRWGVLKFEMDNYDNSWGGMDQNGDILEGAYYWVIDIALSNGQNRIEKGVVTLLNSNN